MLRIRCINVNKTFHLWSKRASVESIPRYNNINYRPEKKMINKT